MSGEFVFSIVHSVSILFVFFFFQAEDGIRDLTVTGVQTCALPIWPMDSEIFIESNVIMRNPNHKFSMLIGLVILSSIVSISGQQPANSESGKDRKSVV